MGAQAHRATQSARPADVERSWFVVDASDQVLGRLATRIAMVLRGKHKPIFTPHVDTGDFVVVVNAEKVRLTGRKMDQKVYRRYTGWAGGLKETPVREMLARKPAEVVRLAVRRMLPKTTLGRNMLKKLKIYAGPEHRHEAQRPQPLDIESFRG